VDSFACGSTPVCEECSRLVASGVVVVAAAGNRGYDNPGDGGFGSYRLSSITDPGNAEDVITVGSTHRSMHHKYGISYFSSRGPTGDGRMKPDLVAPGEKITSTTPNHQWVKLDGTSMAAPHVSGAAALLIARHRELAGNPARIKKILCSTATDLGRTREFQGAGMLDVLRALQLV
jgi:serine protease AprX